jgi:exopolysaccharide biosynthesis polyprenyl glycosylphosphotransferase
VVTGATGPIIQMLSKRRSHRKQWRMFERVAMFVIDAALIDVSFRLSYALRYSVLGNSEFLNDIRRNLDANLASGGFTNTPFSSFFPLEIGIVIGLLLIFSIRGLYTIRLTGSGSLFRQIRTIASAATIGLAVLITYFFVFSPPSSSRLIVPFVWVMSIVVLSLGRMLVSAVMGVLHRLGLGETHVLVVGSGRLAKMIMQNIAANPSLGYSIVGFLHDRVEQPSDFGRFKMLGTLEDLGLVIRSMQVDEVIIALPQTMNQHAIKSVRLLERFGTSFKLVPDIYELSISRIDMEMIEGIPLLNIKQASLNKVQQFVTRIVDVLVSLAVIIVGSPLWLCIALAIRLDSRGPIIYKQDRAGKDGCPFKCYKFRSMYQNSDQVKAALMAQNEANGPIFKIKRDPRITRVGNFLRKASIDEVPQFLNVLKGEMSLVGPRPHPVSEAAQYDDRQRGRLAIKPGLTGLWQIRGRSDISFDEGVLMDLYFIENWSLQLYFQILLRTIPAVVFRRGAY